MGTDLPAAIQNAATVTVPANQRVFVQGQDAAHYLVVSSGSVKVFARSIEGKEIILYRVRAGEMCILTTACLLGHTSYPAEATTETEVTVRTIPASEFTQLLNNSEPFRQFVFTSFGQRLSEILQRFEQMVLESIHSRLAYYLLQQANSRGVVKATHEKLAVEIGTVREVISRHLKSMERAGLIEIQRGKIRILQSATLGNLVEQ